MYSMLTGALSIESALEHMNSTFDFGGGVGTSLTVYGFLAVQIGGLIASLYFMWSVRHPKEE
jgi:hypothetical protein